MGYEPAFGLATAADVWNRPGMRIARGRAIAAAAWMVVELGGADELWLFDEADANADAPRLSRGSR